MTDIRFAKEHMGEYFRYRGYRVRVTGYGTTGIGGRAITDRPTGREPGLTGPSDVIEEDSCGTGRCRYVNREDLK